MTTHANCPHHRRAMLVAGALVAAAAGAAWVVTSTGVPPGAVAAVAAWSAATILATLAIRTGWRRALRPRCDRDAHERLQLLLDRTCLPDVHLHAVVTSAWATPAGQAADTVDVATGHCERVWFPLACFPPGALVLIRHHPDGFQQLDWMPPVEAQAAHRHSARRARREQITIAAHGPWSRRQRGQLVAEVERALRKGVGITPTATTHRHPPAHGLDD